MLLPTGADAAMYIVGVFVVLIVLVVGAVVAIDLILKRRGGFQVGNVKISGEAELDVRKLITAVVELEMRKHGLHHEWVDRCRDKIRVAAKSALGKLKAHTKVAIQDFYIARGEPKVKTDEWRDYASIAELMYYKMVEVGMQSVEQNRYAERNEMEFLALTNEVFARVVQALDGTIYELWDDDNQIQASQIIEWGKPLHGEFRDAVRAVLLECRHLAIQKTEDERKIQKTIDQIVEGGADTIEKPE